MLSLFPSLLIGSVLAGLSAAQPFEEEEFNITQALLGQGVDVFAIPELASLSPHTCTDLKPSTSSCSNACTALQRIYGAPAVETEGEASYANFTGSYWSSIQARVQPRCIFSPSSSSDVSVVVLLSRLTQCPFAVTSGGHAAFAGASSVEGGITVSMRNLNRIRLSRDDKKVSIQPGNTWATTYKYLERYDLAVLGGRVSSVGIGGLTTGGGISFFSNIYGWACDNVAKYKVVTASGRIVTATPDHHADLYWALRGGGNNFGIVVDFTLETIPLPGAAMWGGSRVYLEDAFPAVIDAFAGVVADSPSDPSAGAWVAWAVYQGTKIAEAELLYAEPGGERAAIFDAFNDIAAQSDTTQNRTLAAYTEEINDLNPPGYRECYSSLTVKASPAVLRAAPDIFFEEVQAVLHLAGASPVMVFQAITTGDLQAMTKNGGNPLGLSVEDGPFYIIQASSWWDDEEDDEAMYAMLSRVLSRVKDEASSLGAQNDYVYMNYASKFQDVISSYGPENKARLKRIAAEYDPRRVFQTLQPGHFKLDRAPVPNSTYFSF